jgi:nucleotide-binding universal stress UspA family protein
VLVVGDQRRVRGDVAPAVTKIVCPVNFSEVAMDALREAAALAGSFDAELIAVHVLEPGVDPIGNEEEQLRDWTAPLLPPAARYRQFILRGDPAERILESVDDLAADLLVAGAQHTLFRNATVIGTTTDRLVRFAPCPVLVIPRAARAVKRQSRESEFETVGVF